MGLSWHNPTMAQLPSVVLKDPSSALTATFVPSAGMICTSLSDGGVELLGQRRGLRAYLTTGKTMGIPILYPWANRLSANGYAVDGGAVTLTPGVGGARSDEHGLVIHGVLAAYPGWLVTEQEDNRVIADLDYGGQPRLLASFPFPHVVTLDITLADRACAHLGGDLGGDPVADVVDRHPLCKKLGGLQAIDRPLAGAGLCQF
jgi:galactose mutarotase-like enzyme